MLRRTIYKYRLTINPFLLGLGFWIVGTIKENRLTMNLGPPLEE